jgi:hypothetical protein
MSLDTKDLGIGKLMQQLERLGELRVTFGYQGASGQAKHPGAKVSVAKIAAFQEFGTATAPARPLGQHTMEENRDAFADAAKSAISDIVDGRASSANKAVQAVGEIAVSAARKTIDRSRDWAEANAPSTIAKKGHDQPLIGEYAQLYSQVSWAIRKGDRIVKQGGEG